MEPHLTMATVLFSILVFLLAAIGLAVGVLCGRRAIKASCGGCTKCITGEKHHD